MNTKEYIKYKGQVQKLQEIHCTRKVCNVACMNVNTINNEKNKYNMRNI